ncbi:MAG: alpha/beta fold hydrolase [Candidatus Dormibacteria bacterium]
MATAAPGSIIPERHRVDLGGAQVSWLERPGADPPVLLLHGWGAEAATFSGLLRLCRTPRRLVAVDLPGFGHSPLGAPTWTTASYAQLIGALAADQGWARPSLIGHSYGGGVSLHLASGPSALVDRLLLCAASGIRVPRRGGVGAKVRLFRTLRRAAETLLPRSAAELAVEWLRQRLGSADYRQAGELRPVLVRAVQEDLGLVAAEIRVPTLIVWGSADSELPLDPHGQRLQQLIAGSELVRFQGSGHFPFVDQPGRFAAVVDAFMDAQL